MSNDISAALAETSDGTIISIEVTTGSKKDEFPASYNPWRNAVGCHVSALPVEGRANTAVVSLISKTFGVPKMHVTIVSGMTSSQKKVLISEVDLKSVLAVLKNRMG